MNRLVQPDIREDTAGSTLTGETRPARSLVHGAKDAGRVVTVYFNGSDDRYSLGFERGRRSI